jgi:hypothetical protein
MEPEVGIQKSFRPGTPVPLTGIYLALHAAEHHSRTELVLMRDRIFPLCETCGQGVVFQLLYAAPYIGDDADFAGDVERVRMIRPHRARFAHAR